MANTYIVSGSRFKPYSFDEMIKPYQMYTEAYNQVENELGNLDLMASDVDSKLSQDDAVLKNTYKSFKEDLNKAMNSLYEKGLNSTTKKELLKLKSRYTKELNPINEAYKAFQEDQAYLNKLAIEHPEILIEGAGNKVSDYIGGNRPNFVSVSLNDLTKDVMQMSAAASERTYKDLGWSTEAGNKILANITRTGFKEEEFNKALQDYLQGNPNNDPNADLIGRIYENAISQYGNFNNQDRIKSSIIEGMKKGFAYKEDKKTYTNPDYKPGGSEDGSVTTLNDSIINTITLGSEPVDRKLGRESEKGKEFMSDIRVIPNSNGTSTISNTEIDLLSSKVNEIQEELTSLQEGQLYKGNIPYKQAKRNLTMRLNLAQANLERASERFAKQYEEYSNKYDYLNLGDSNANIDLGLKYDDARSKEQLFIADLAKDPTYEKKLDEAIKREFKGISGGNVGIFDENDSKALSTKDADELLGDDNTRVIVKSDKGIVLQTSDGVKEIKGSDKIDSFNNNYKKTVNFLKDYTKPTINNTNITLSDEISDLSNETLAKLAKENKIEVIADDKGDQYLGITIKDTNTGDLKKIVIHPLSGYVGYSSLNDIANGTGGGSIRAFQEDMLSRGLIHYFNLNTQK